MSSCAHVRLAGIDPKMFYTVVKRMKNATSCDCFGGTKSLFSLMFAKRISLELLSILYFYSRASKHAYLAGFTPTFLGVDQRVLASFIKMIENEDVF